MRHIRLFLIVFFSLFIQIALCQHNLYVEDLQGIEIVNIENDGVKRYLEDQTYDNPANTSKYSLSVVHKYTSGYSSKPNGKHISWQHYFPLEKLMFITVTVSDNWTFPNDRSKYYHLDVTETEYTICNMIPDKTYYYKVEEFGLDGTSMTVAKGTFVTTGNLRMLRIEGMINIRDFGGWKTSLGNRTTYGRIYRGNRPDGITYKGKNDFVENEHLTADLDLRGKQLPESPFGPLNQVEYFCTNNARYKSALVSRTDIFVKDFHFIADVLRRGGAVFLHCNHGANRAGTLSFLIDGIIGLSEADICRDYELSAFAYKGMKRGSNIGDMISYIRTFGNLGDDLTKCFYNYFIHIGVEEEDINTIRTIMTKNRK